jgi:hypothetical protein
MCWHCYTVLRFGRWVRRLDLVKSDASLTVRLGSLPRSLLQFDGARNGVSMARSVIRLRPGRCEVQMPAGARDFCLLQNVRTVLWPILPPGLWILGIKRVIASTLWVQHEVQ